MAVRARSPPLSPFLLATFTPSLPRLADLFLCTCADDPFAISIHHLTNIWDDWQGMGDIVAEERAKHPELEALSIGVEETVSARGE